MLSQREANVLINTPKRFVSAYPVGIPAGADQTYQLVSHDHREQFLLDVWRGTIRLSKLKMQTRAKVVYVLVRLDIDGAPHTNPDGTRVPGTHLHHYREGYGDKWATALGPRVFSDTSNIRRTFEDFLRHCNVTELPIFREGVQ
jgi:hypothetical protein